MISEKPLARQQNHRQRQALRDGYGKRPTKKGVYIHNGGKTVIN